MDGTAGKRRDAQTLQDLVDALGGIPLSRILAKPAPGLATEAGSAFE